ncbi:MAG: nucleoside triphosphate pyrophosphohydrolase [Chloroflexi bacterium]|uniref:Nucleoside triphosphate pyrophosphohydrolase n=1 Tax=Candidatus Chlorohelix allophototropha TaxID=3003348 RepID=A0A8T7M529_9CHLR|nr:nucleoside triphosphate pyrophosphohydrolase [Chloroflexota bacterium]WJW69085.1 nucleoside triphosphate pyrophosphohydrolase [Chloroflexota bacterium L227-S17]
MENPPTVKIIVIGLGPGNPDHLTFGALRAMREAGTVWLRTAKHPTVSHLPPEVKLESFDDYYDRFESFEAVYGAIVDRLLAIAKESAKPIAYAVPGHPLVGESSVTRLLAKAREAGIAIEIVDGLSFIEPALDVLTLDPLQDSLTILDALELAARPESHLPREKGLELPILRPLLVGQVYNQRLASAVKLALMEDYPDGHQVTLLRGAGVPGEQARLDIPLFELDRHPEWTDHLTCVYVPPLPILEATGSFANVQYILARLRGPGGCPWDREQTHTSLKRYLIEETYEVIHALDEAPEKLVEEFGDLLLQVVLHAQIGADEGEYDIREVMRELSLKMIHRHPHVFGVTNVNGAEEVVHNWEQLKKIERAGKSEEEQSVLGGVPHEMPALLQAQNLQRKAASLGFVWRNLDQVLDKLVEEIEEVRHTTNHEELVEEIGDVFMVMCAAARDLKVDAEEALRLANLKFRKRFTEWEKLLHERNLDGHKMELPELETLWQEARKRAGK